MLSSQVEDLMTKYTDENQTLFSGLRYDSKKPVLQGDPDLLLYHTLRYVSVSFFYILLFAFEYSNYYIFF